MEKNKNNENSEISEMREIAQSVEKTMADFLESMRLREELSIKIGRRTSQIIRVGSFTVTLLCIAIIYLTSSLNTDMKRMALRMDEISITMKSMDGSMNSVPTMAASVTEMTRGVNTMSRDVTEMTRQIHFLNGNVGAMGHDVNRMSAPMRMFPMP